MYIILLFFFFKQKTAYAMRISDGRSDVCSSDLLGLEHGQWLVTFQSRFGREQWLQPATDATLRTLAGAGVGRLDVVCPGFPADCLETLEEIALQNAEVFRAAGGQALSYIPCL